MAVIAVPPSRGESNVPRVPLGINDGQIAHRDFELFIAQGSGLMLLAQPPVLGHRLREVHCRASLSSERRSPDLAILSTPIVAPFGAGSIWLISQPRCLLR
jgi:hypothetical protein